MNILYILYSLAGFALIVLGWLIWPPHKQTQDWGEVEDSYDSSMIWGRVLTAVGSVIFVLFGFLALRSLADTFGSRDVSVIIGASIYALILLVSVGVYAICIFFPTDRR